MPSLRYREEMRGHVAFGEREKTSLAFQLSITIEDVDAFIADDHHLAKAEGIIVCDQLGGTLEVADGRFMQFEPDGGPRTRRMRYVLPLRDPSGRLVTFEGIKEIADDPGPDMWADTSTLFASLHAGHHPDGPIPQDTLIARGILRLNHLDLLLMLTSMRVSGGGPWARARAALRFQKHFLGSLHEVYGGKPVHDAPGDFPGLVRQAAALDGRPPRDWHDLAGHPGLHRRIIPFAALDGRPLTMHHIRGDAESSRGPVLLAHGTGVRAQSFYGAPDQRTVVDALVTAGYEPWIMNWRTSIDLPPCSWFLDDAAVYDHPAAVALIKQETGRDRFGAFVHCQGSTSLMMASLAGLVPELTHVVSHAVSLHVKFPGLTRVKQTLLTPLAKRSGPGVSPQWAVRSPSAVARGTANYARLIRRECDDPVCNMSQWAYGTGEDVLWSHDNLDHATHGWTSREFGYTPFTFHTQMGASARRGHIVPLSGRPEFAADLTTMELPEGQRWTFLAGTGNRCFLPEGQRLTFEHFDARDRHRHEFKPLKDYGHMDALFGTRAHIDVHPLVVKALDAGA
jgi:hypothetical protein